MKYLCKNKELVQLLDLEPMKIGGYVRIPIVPELSIQYVDQEDVPPPIPSITSVTFQLVNVVVLNDEELVGILEFIEEN